MNIVESRLLFTTPPVSIRKFNQQKNLAERKPGFDSASLYIIAKREVPTIRVIEHSPIEEYVKDQDIEKYVLINIKMHEAGFDVDAAFFLPEGVAKAEFIASINDTSIEEMLACAARKIGFFGCACDITPLITYEVLYVGQCVGESLTKRFKAHHALQNMLIEENVISRKFDKADELILMPLSADSDVVSILTPDCTEDDYLKAFTNSFNFGSKEIVLDAEKALVHNMNPKYNKIKFEKYPQSKDGLHNTDAHAYSYSLVEFAILKYTDGMIVGFPDDMYASRIVGDDEGFTKVYKPGDDITKKYIPRIMSYMGNDVMERFYKRADDEGTVNE